MNSYTLEPVGFIRSTVKGREDAPRQGPEGAPLELAHRDCGAPVRLHLECDAGHELDSAREVTTRPGPGARRIA